MDYICRGNKIWLFCTWEHWIHFLCVSSIQQMHRKKYFKHGFLCVCIYIYLASSTVPLLCTMLNTNQGMVHWVGENLTFAFQPFMPAWVLRRVLILFLKQGVANTLRQSFLLTEMVEGSLKGAFIPFWKQACMPPWYIYFLFREIKMTRNANNVTV